MVKIEIFLFKKTIKYGMKNLKKIKNKLESIVSSLSFIIKDRYDSIIEKQRINEIKEKDCCGIAVGIFYKTNSSFGVIQQPAGSFCVYSRKYYSPLKNLKCEFLNKNERMGPFYGCNKKK